jgi:hypothetical protein
MRPKWLLTMPDGKLMVEKAVEKLDLTSFSRIALVCLREHLETYLSTEAIENILNSFSHPQVELCVLEEATESQSETVVKCIEQLNITGPFFVKDCDNVFDVSWTNKNEIAVLDLNDVGLIDAKNKSFVTTDALGNVSNIVEKQVISNLFCCGGYGFESAELFLRHFYTISGSHEVYISHVIYSMLMDNVQFQIAKASGYTDWGTLREFRHYSKSFFTLFCDVDGVLLFNGSKFGKNGWSTEPIVENLKTISRLQQSGQLYLVITSSRPESQIPYLTERLGTFNVIPDRYVMGLPHTRRVLVNDYSSTNPYPSALSVNLERDSRLLSSILDSIS